MAGADLLTVGRLAFRHLAIRRGRALLLLFGYALGAGVMMVLLSVGEAMLIQSRDVALVGGGEVTVLPEGIDLEAVRTGSMGGLFHGIDRARFLQRQLVGGPRVADVVAAVSPEIDDELVYLVRGDGFVPLRAGGELPDAARRVGAGLPILAGEWRDAEVDRRFARPEPEELYHELDRFHRPAADSTWAEWHYFNVAPSAEEWWYLTYIVGGPLGAGGGGGRLLVTRNRAGRAPARFESFVPAPLVRFDTATADLSIGESRVIQRAGRYHLTGAARGAAGTVRFDLELVPERNAYFPPLELTSDRFISGYVVPALRARVDGTICEGSACRRLAGASGYHDHNWGIWRETTWNWGQGRAEGMSFVYGGVLTADSLASPSAAPYFLAVVDSLGVRQVLRFARIEYRGARPVLGVAGVAAPDSFRLVAVRERDTVAVAVTVRHGQATPGAPGGRVFLQLRGAFRVTGRLGGRAVADSGLGFFETFVSRDSRESASRPRSGPRDGRSGGRGTGPTASR